MIFIFLTTICLFSIVNAQTFQLQSFDGTKVKVQLAYNPALGTLAIACAKDTIYLVDYMDLDDVKILNDRFLQVSYAKRAGSNEGLANTLLLSVDHNKLIQGIHIKSFSEYDMRNLDHIKGSLSEYQLFKVKTQLLGHDKTTYKLNLNIHDESNSERLPKTNHNYNTQLILNFDPKKNIFYDTHQTIAKTFMVYNPKNQRTTKQYLNGKVPVITIGKSSYYYINGEWYEKGDNNYLLKSAYK